MARFAVRAAKFVAVFLCCTIAFTFLWEQLVTDALYNCTDPGWLDYLSPGHWVHNPVSVRHISGGRPMSEPDTIKEGWNVTRLWYLWFSVVGISVVMSAMLAWVPWIPKRWID